jgi:hypothetical protein
MQATHDITGAVAFRVDQIFVCRTLAPTLVRAEGIRQPGFWRDGPLSPDA